MVSDSILQRIRSTLSESFGGRLQGIVLYGSEARGEAIADSDLDLLVLLTGPVDDDSDSWMCIRSLYPLVLELERPIHAEPTDIRVYEAQEYPLYRAAEAEGIHV